MGVANGEGLSGLFTIRHSLFPIPHFEVFVDRFWFLTSANWAADAPWMLLALAIGYLLGSIPFGLVLTKLAGGPDIRTIGSGNIGATNVLRTGNKKLAAATLLFDGLKGTAAALVGYRIGGPQLALLGCMGALLGHVFPIWLGFKGGKGVATFIGCLFGVAWPAGVQRPTARLRNPKSTHAFDHTRSRLSMRTRPPAVAAC